MAGKQAYEWKRNVRGERCGATSGASTNAAAHQLKQRGRTQRLFPASDRDADEPPAP